MPQSLSKLDVIAIPESPTDAINLEPTFPIAREHTLPSGGNRLSESEQFAFGLGRAVRTMSDFCTEIGQAGIDRYGEVVESTRGLIRQLPGSVKQAKRDHPVRFLAIITGAAFLLGVAARVVSNRHDA